MARTKKSPKRKAPRSPKVERPVKRRREPDSRLPDVDDLTTPERLTYDDLKFLLQPTIRAARLVEISRT